MKRHKILTEEMNKLCEEKDKKISGYKLWCLKDTRLEPFPGKEQRDESGDFVNLIPILLRPLSAGQFPVPVGHDSLLPGRLTSSGQL